MDRQGIRGRMAQIGVTQEQLAQAMGIERTLFSRILRGRRPMPEGMEARIHAVLDQLKEKLRAEPAEPAEAVEKRVAEMAEAVEKQRVETVELEKQRVETVELAEAVEKLLTETVEKLRREEAK